MSLFGTTPSDSGNDPGQSSQPALRRSGGLFDEPEPVSSSLFHKDDAGDEHRDDTVQQNHHHGTSSPWDLPTPRRQQSRAELIRSLLPSSEVPDSYIDAFDRVVREDGVEGKVSTAGIAKVLALARLDAGAQARIMSLVAPENASGVMLGRNEFNVLLALVGLAQEGDEISLDGVDERRRNIPRPELSGLTAEPVLPLAPEMSSARLPQSPRPQPEMQPPMQPQSQVRPQTRPPTQTPAMDMPEDDPWSAPELHKGHAHEARMEQQYHDAATNGRNGYDSMQPPFRERLGSDQHNARQYSGPPERARPPPHQPAPSSGYRHVSTSSMAAAAAATNGWAAAFPSDVNTPPVSSAGYHEPSTRHQPGGVPSPFGGDGLRHSGPLTPSRSLGGRAGGGGETVVVTLMPGKEGIFLFQHHNYEVASYRRGSKVVRRYSDFVWLLDCLHKRYPFRSLPLLPPKRVAVNGNHLSNDGSFIEKRRRGLSRFLNALVRHPVLSQEQLVVMFLTVPTELSVWRKQATISVQDEFSGRALPEGLADSLPPQLENLFLQTRNGVRRSAELYITACNVMDRLVRRGEGVAADHGRLAMTLTSLTEASEDSYATDAHQVGLLNDGLVAMSRHLRTCQNLMEDEGRGWEQGVLEDLKRQRDALVSLRDMFERRERLDRDGIPELRKRIAASEGKLAGLRARVEEGGVVRAGEMERLAESIVKDKESIVQQDNRSIFIKECIRDELVTFQQSQYHVSRWNQDWAGERVKYAEMLADNWRRLLDALEGMPLGE